MAALPLVSMLGLVGSAAAAGSDRLLPSTMRVAQLENGLTVVALPVETPGLVAVQTWMGVGARDEVEQGMTGFAHFFEHLMFHGSEAIPREARETRLLALAVDENAWTDADRTVYVARAPAGSLNALLELEADRFAALSLTAEGVRRESGAVLGEYLKGQASPDRRVHGLLWETAFTVAPYGHPVIGLEADIQGMPEGLARAVAFHRTHYRPERATVVVAGDVDPESVIDTVRRTHGSWLGAEDAAAAPARPVEPPQEAPREATEIWSRGAVNTRLAVGWRVPAFVPGDRDSAALVLLSDLLGGASARLRRRLVDEEALAWSVWVPEPVHRSPGLLEIHVEVREGVESTAVEAVIAEELRRLGGDASASRDVRQEDVDGEVARAAARARRSGILALDSAASWAGAVGEMTLMRGDPRDLERHFVALGAVDGADIRRVIDSHLDARNRTTVRLLAPVVPAPPLEDTP